MTTDLSTRSDKDLYAYYKRTAPAGDIQFYLDHWPHLNDQLRAEGTSLLAGKPTRATALKFIAACRANHPERLLPNEALFWEREREPSAELHRGLIQLSLF